MRRNFGAKPLSYPQPVFIIATYNEDGTPNAMNAAWGGISEMTEISLCLSAGHKTVKNIQNRQAFTVSMAEASHVAACDYVGIVSGNTSKGQIRKSRIPLCKIHICRCATDRRAIRCFGMQIN